MHDLRQRMHTGIGAPGTAHAHRRRRCASACSSTSCTVCHEPAIASRRIRAVVFDAERDSHVEEQQQQRRAAGQQGRAIGQVQWPHGEAHDVGRRAAVIVVEPGTEPGAPIPGRRFALDVVQGEHEALAWLSAHSSRRPVAGLHCLLQPLGQPATASSCA